MVKKKQPSEAEEQKKEPVTEVLEDLKQQTVLDQIALGIVKTQNGWGVAEIAFNVESGECDLQNVQLAGISREEAIELFKITAVEKGLV
jgi:hypothetical protein